MEDARPAHEPDAGRKKGARWWKRTEFWVLAGALAIIPFAVRYTQKTNEQIALAVTEINEHLSNYRTAEAEDVFRQIERKGADERVRQTAERIKTAQHYEAVYQDGLASLQAKEWKDAVGSFEEVKGYRDSDRLAEEARISGALAYIEATQWLSAEEILQPLADASPRVAELKARVRDGWSQEYYDLAVKAKADGNYVIADRNLIEAKRVGGKVSGDVESELKAIAPLKAKQEAVQAATAAAARLEAIRQDMVYYTSDPVGLAVGGAEFSNNISVYSATGNGVFVLIFVHVKNNDLSSEHVNPLNFTLTGPDGHTVPIHNATYSLRGYLDAVNISQGQKTSGWIAFSMPKADTYKLSYRSFLASTAQEIAPR